MFGRRKGKYFYVIVHANLIEKFRRAYREINRIHEEEQFAEVRGEPSAIPPDLPKNTKIAVCGAYRNLCVKAQLDALKQKGYDAFIYSKATIR